MHDFFCLLILDCDDKYERYVRTESLKSDGIISLIVFFSSVSLQNERDTCIFIAFDMIFTRHHNIEFFRIKFFTK